MHEQSQTTTTETAESLRWYALKVFYNRIMKIESVLTGAKIRSYIPMRSVVQVVGGRRVSHRKPAISSLMFMQCSEVEATQIERRLMGEAMIYRNRGEKLPTAIPNEQMQMFIRVTSIEDCGMEYLGEVSDEWTKGDKVRVTGGLFEGAEGYIKRIKGNHRLVVAIEGITAVATSYIPTCYLERIE